MPKTHFPRQGGYSFVQSFYSDTGAVGNVFWVNSATGTDSTGAGFSPEAPFATIAYAVATAAVANNGDLVLVAPGHTEVCIAAGTILMSKAGVTLRGLGQGRLRPVITYTTAAAASFNVTGANCRIENIVFSGVGVAAVTAMVNVSVADVTFFNCEFELGNVTNQAVLGILTTAGANRLVVDSCYFHNTADAGVTAAITIVGGDGIRIINSIFIGAYTSGIGAINQITTTTTQCFVIGNFINNLTASCTKAMVFTASSTGMIANNRMQILSGATPITGAAMSWVGGNYYGATIGQLGVLI